MTTGYSHLDEIRDVKAHTEGCAECLKVATAWVDLRLCLVCGYVGCCDNFDSRHAMKHFYMSGHPVIRSLAPGESSGWCYVDEAWLTPEEMPERLRRRAVV
jgi:hypothetical protein